MEPNIQIEAIRVIENRINAIDNKFNDEEKVKNEISFKEELDNIIKNSQKVKKEAKAAGSATIKNSENQKNSKVLNEIMSTAESISEKNKIDSNLIKAMIEVESSFNPNAVSSAGAMGLMQLMPETAESLGVNDPYNIQQNLSGGIKYIKNLLDRFSGSIELALAAYNAGPGRVEEYGTIPPIEETQNYVNKVLSIYNQRLL